MRIIAGTAKGMPLSAPEGGGTRPVLDRVKESWFSVLGARLVDASFDGADVLDLYAGVGSLGIEALSRGAASCVFVESAPECVALLREHLAKARLADRAEVRTRIVEVALADLAREGRSFDLVFADPPFALAATEAFYAADGVLARAGALVSPGGLLMLRRESRAGASPTAPEGISLTDTRTWGRNEVCFLAPRAREIRET